jgi:hypothetical protein
MLFNLFFCRLMGPTVAPNHLPADTGHMGHLFP